MNDRDQKQDSVRRSGDDREPSIRIRNEDLAWLVGSSITELSYSRKSAWFFISGGGLVDTRGCPWRLSDMHELIACSSDLIHHSLNESSIDFIDMVRAAVVGERITAAMLRDGPPDLLLEIAGHLTLEVLATSVESDNWESWSPAGVRLLVTASRRATVLPLPFGS